MSFEEQRFVEMLKNAVERVKNEEDPVELNQYKKLFKKNVPFTLRSYVAAYLAKNSGFTGRRENFRNRRDMVCDGRAGKRMRLPALSRHADRVFPVGREARHIVFRMVTGDSREVRHLRVVVLHER